MAPCRFSQGWSLPLSDPTSTNDYGFSFRILSFLDSRVPKAPVSVQPPLLPQMTRPPSASAYSPANAPPSMIGFQVAPFVAPALAAIRSGSVDDAGRRVRSFMLVCLLAFNWIFYAHSRLEHRHRQQWQHHYLRSPQVPSLCSLECFKISQHPYKFPVTSLILTFGNHPSSDLHRQFHIRCPLHKLSPSVNRPLCQLLKQRLRLIRRNKYVRRPSHSNLRSSHNKLTNNR